MVPTSRLKVEAAAPTRIGLSRICLALFGSVSAQTHTARPRGSEHGLAITKPITTDVYAVRTQDDAIGQQFRGQSFEPSYPAY